MEVGLGPGHIVLDGDPAPTKKGHSPPILAQVCCGQTAGWIKIPLGTNVGLGPCHIVLHGNPAPPIRGTDPAIFSPCLLWPRSSISSQLLLSSLLYILQLSQCFTLYSFPSLSLLSKNQHSHIIPHCHLFLLITNWPHTKLFVKSLQSWSTPVRFFLIFTNPHTSSLSATNITTGNDPSQVFLANVHVHYMLSPVRLSSVCPLSVTFVHPTQPVRNFGNVSMPFGTLAIRWHPRKILRRSSQGNPSSRGIIHNRVAKYNDFGPIKDYIL